LSRIAGFRVLPPGKYQAGSLPTGAQLPSRSTGTEKHPECLRGEQARRTLSYIVPQSLPPAGRVRAQEPRSLAAAGSHELVRPPCQTRVLAAGGPFDMG